MKREIYLDPESFELAVENWDVPKLSSLALSIRKVFDINSAAAYDLFRIEGPAVISFSGGLTSGFMLWLILRAHGGKLPPDVYVMFANTGKEDEETLIFIHNVEIYWGVKIHWVEFRARESMDDAKQHVIVTFETASRNGEPFEAIIDERKMLPNPLARFCRTELKYRTMHRVISEHLGLEEWTAVIGMRADEPDRVAKLSNQDDPREEKIAPLATAGVRNHDVLAFWKTQPFTLRLPIVNGKTLGGNCDNCMLKAADTKLTLARHKPESLVWWIKQERKAKAWKEQGIITGNGDKFRLDQPSCESLMNFALTHGEMFSFGDADIVDCACGG